ncbi:MAG: UvrD-helicase domain-containing protein [Acidobacteria bacterium]|nr:UvrD-helicase domain-containing protein [Acidobacteriota bacterium]
MIPWDTLNPEQRQAVESWDESLLVMAPVGTGKTNVLSLRAAHAIESGLAPSSILCLSFTNKAANELRARLSIHLGKLGGEITARTFHGLCAQILRAEASAVGWDRDFVVYDEEDCRTLCGEAAAQFGLAASRDLQNELEFFLFQVAGDARLSPFEETPGRSPQEHFHRRLAESRLDFLKRRVTDYKPILSEYIHRLRDRHAVDFADLIAGVNRLWQERPDVLERWQRRFAWIQVDEVQDTSRAEYLPLRLLAERSRRLSFFGDVDQTIYEWRGSAPAEILADYRSRFAPVREIQFTRNYRSTKRILEACEQVIRSCPGSVTGEILPQAAEEGDALECYEATDLSDEARWLAGRIQTIAAAGVPLRDIAILTRTNFTLRDLSTEFTALGLPHLKVDEFKFFQRTEVKDALAHIRLLLNPHDEASLLRFLKTPAKGIGDATLAELRGAPRDAGLKLGDLLDPAVYERGDPFLALLEAARASRVVVFDIETTGLKIGEDEIVELAATRCGASGAGESFHAYLKPSRPVGDSEPIHHLSDSFLAENGEEPAAVLERFRAFCRGCVLTGHNIPQFDLPMLRSACLRLGLPEWERAAVFDTLDLTRRFHRLPRYKLGDVCRKLGLKCIPTHRADSDVAATVELLQALLPRLEDGLAARAQAIKRHGARFRSLACQAAAWRTEMELERPHELLERVLQESGLLRHYGEDEERRGHLDELLSHFRRLDEPDRPPVDALFHVLNAAALAREIDGQKFDDDQVLLLTVHQAKGLEFDTVFLAGAADSQFPSRRSLKEGRELEEHRLFYVAASRAKKRLYFSYPRIDKWGREQLRSRYLRAIFGSR